MRQGHPAVVTIGGRHDASVIPRIIPVCEAMVAIVLADHLMRQRAIYAMTAPEKAPYAALRFTPRRCGVRQSTPHSSGLARLASGAFCEAVRESIFLLSCLL